MRHCVAACMPAYRLHTLTDPKHFMGARSSMLVCKCSLGPKGKHTWQLFERIPKVRMHVVRKQLGVGGGGHEHEPQWGHWGWPRGGRGGCSRTAHNHIPQQEQQQVDLHAALMHLHTHKMRVAHEAQHARAPSCLCARAHAFAPVQCIVNDNISFFYSHKCTRVPLHVHKSHQSHRRVPLVHTLQGAPEQSQKLEPNDQGESKPCNIGAVMVLGCAQQVMTCKIHKSQVFYRQRKEVPCQCQC